MSRRRNSGRNVHGIILLDKPKGITSNAALQTVKRLFQANKAGHTGSLDPLASGMLPVCLGEATKVSAFLLDADKSYRAVCKLGVTTTTGDAEGSIIDSRPVGPISPEQLQSVLAGFRGGVEQIPPMHSAIKQGGVPLYKLAHQGLEVERAPRTVTIHRLEVLRFEGDELEIEVDCSKGTYLRVLAEDIGRALGCGAHLSDLVRTRVGLFEAAQMHTLEELRGLAQHGTAALDALLLPVDCALQGWPGVDLSDDAAYYLRKGQPVFVPRGPVEGWVRLYTAAHRFLGVGQVLDDGRVAPRRLVNIA